jgi:hypothetical protein
MTVRGTDIGFGGGVGCAAPCRKIALKLHVV